MTTKREWETRYEIMEASYLHLLRDYHNVIKEMVPCGCDLPLLGHRPGVGPRCRLCGKQYQIMEA